jgi:hypothetical protein
MVGGTQVTSHRELAAVVGLCLSFSCYAAICFFFRWWIFIE